MWGASAGPKIGHRGCGGKKLAGCFDPRYEPAQHRRNDCERLGLTLLQDRSGTPTGYEGFHSWCLKGLIWSIVVEEKRQADEVADQRGLVPRVYASSGSMAGTKAVWLAGDIVAWRKSCSPPSWRAGTRSLWIADKSLGDLYEEPE